MTSKDEVLDVCDQMEKNRRHRTHGGRIFFQEANNPRSEILADYGIPEMSVMPQIDREALGTPFGGLRAG